MGAPTLEDGPYVFNVNNLFSESTVTNITARILLELKNALVALGGAGVIWDVVASSNSVSVKNIGDATPDLWSALSDLVYSSSGVHSWCILENQTTGGQLCIDYEGTYNRQCTILFSATGSFAADGTTSARPTSTEAYYIATTTYSFWIDSNDHRKCVVNVMASNDHATTRFYVHGRNASSGAYGGFYGAIERVVNTPAAWTSTIPTLVTYYRGNVEASTTTYDMSPELDVFDGTCLYNYIETADPYAGWLSGNMTAEGYNNWSGTNNADIINRNNVDQDVIGGYPILPIGIYRPSSSYGGSLGRLRDVYLGQRSHSTLDTFPFDASRTWIKWGCLVVPWNGSVPQDAV